jgi:hypothetical protein
MLKKIIKKTEYTVTVNNKKHIYTLEKIDNESSYIYCESAEISQPFANEDIPELLMYLPDYIIDRQVEKKTETDMRFRCSVEEKKLIQKNALKYGYKTTSSFLKSLALKA